MTAPRVSPSRSAWPRLDQFKMREDRNGVATKGLLFMEKSWDTAYLWETQRRRWPFSRPPWKLRKPEPAASRRV